MVAMSLTALLALYLFIDPVSEAAWRAGRRLGRARAVPTNLFEGLLDELYRVAPLDAAARPVAVRVLARAEPRPLR